MRKIIFLLLLATLLLVFGNPEPSISLNKDAFRRREKVVVSLKGFPPDTSIALLVRNPLGTPVLVDEVRSDSMGCAQYSFTISDHWVLGEYTIVADTGSPYNCSVSKVFYVKALSLLKISIFQGSGIVFVGDMIRLRGLLRPPINTVVTIELSVDNGRNWTTLANVNTSYGYFYYNWTPVLKGVYLFRARWSGNDKYFETISNVIRISVHARKASVSLQVFPQVILVGEEVTIKGTLVPSIGNAVLKLIYTSPKGDIIEKTVITNEKGIFTDTFKPDVYGIWTVYATCPMDPKCLGALSSKVEFKVKGVSVLDLFVEPRLAAVNDTVLLVCRLSPNIENSSITIEYRLGNGNWTPLA
ncbi:MAG TPA: hypothetical protein ENF87_03325, partial [Thermoproteales archaeon]|nr:hypothetical protein [Thermoproteales archaeon]